MGTLFLPSLTYISTYVDYKAYEIFVLKIRPIMYDFIDRKPQYILHNQHNLYGRHNF